MKNNGTRAHWDARGHNAAFVVKVFDPFIICSSPGRSYLSHQSRCTLQATASTSDTQVEHMSFQWKQNYCQDTFDGLIFTWHTKSLGFGLFFHLNNPKWTMHQGVIVENPNECSSSSLMQHSSKRVSNSPWNIQSGPSGPLLRRRLIQHSQHAHMLCCTQRPLERNQDRALCKSPELPENMGNHWQKA